MLATSREGEGDVVLIEPAGREFTLHDQARALAVVLQSEFEAPFTLYAASGEVVVAGATALRPDEIAGIAAGGQAVILSRRDGACRVAVVLHHAGQPALVAAAEIESLAAPAHAEREEARLRRWLQSVAERLRLSDHAAASARRDDTLQARAPWEALLGLDQLLRRLRLHRDSGRNQRRILEAARPLIDAQTLVWVPLLASEPVLIEGEQILNPADCRKLAGVLGRTLDSSPGEPILCNDAGGRSWSGYFPQLNSVMAFAIADQGTLGYLLALNKGQGPAGERRGPRAGAFRSADAALLSAFVGLLRLQMRTHDRYQRLKELLVSLTRSLTAALDAKDSYTYGHSERVARIAVELGRELGLQGDDLSDIYLTGLLHDVGKIGIKDAILCKGEALTAEEFEHVKQHVTVGYNILADLGPIRHLLPGVLYHHERWDGKGYPDGLSGEAIPRLARILAVADAYDAMSTSRPHREALPCRRVEDVLGEGAGSQWDAEVIGAFQRCRLRIHAIRQRGVGESLRFALEGALSRQGQNVKPTLEEP
jgi:hypothetical protein